MASDDHAEEEAVNAMVRRGDWMQTVSGRQFWPLDPRVEDVDIGDIAHALAHQCRFAGHCREFYSVAQHSVLVSYQCAPADRLAGLLHDAAEAYVVDLPRPLKRQPVMAPYRLAEDAVQVVIFTAFALSPFIPESVRLADDVVLATERRDLMAISAVDWDLGVEPLVRRIDPLSPALAREMFLDRFRCLAVRA